MTATTNKPIVHYVGKAMPVFEDQARLIPMDHPRKELNDSPIITSRVLQWLPHGHIETRNTRYVPVKLPDMPWEKPAEGKCAS
jgi:hypothetical protein